MPNLKMKDDDDGGDEGCGDGGEWLILCCLRGFEEGQIDISDCRVAFATGKCLPFREDNKWIAIIFTIPPKKQFQVSSDSHNFFWKIKQLQL